MNQLSTGNKIILFDGVCNLCNNSVQFIIKRDKKKQFSFASLQGNFGQEFLKKHSLPADNFNSFILLEDEKIYTRSTGALRMLKHLGGGLGLLYGFIILPKFTSPLPGAVIITFSPSFFNALKSGVHFLTASSFCNSTSKSRCLYTPTTSSTPNTFCNVSGYSSVF